MTSPGRHVGLGALAVLLLALTIPHLPNMIVTGNPGVIQVPRDYGTIQAAVNAASPGDTIVVSASGSPYAGNITISKSLTLMGASPSSTVIDAGNIGPGVLINATSDVQVSGFKIINADTFDSGVEILSSSNVQIRGNIINTTVTYPGNGVLVQDSNLVTLKNNTITRGIYGVLVKGGFSNTIQSNVIYGNSAVDVHLNDTAGSIVNDNVLRMSNRGLDVWFGSGGNSITLNTMANNTLAGLWIISSNNNQIVANNIDWNNASSGSLGIYLQSTAGNLFYYNNIRHNSVQMFGVYDSDMGDNVWNDQGTNPRGNFWSNYLGADNDTDGVGDTMIPWPCPNGGKPCSSSSVHGVDYYPLLSPTQLTTLNMTLTASPLSGCAIPIPLSVKFNSTVQGGSPPYQYSWRFGDGTTAGNFSTTTHTYVARGGFFATLTVTDQLGPGNAAFDTVSITSFTGGLALRVLDTSGNPLSGANVTSTSQPAGLGRLSQETNSTGYVDFPCLPPGPYRFQASASNYQVLPVALTVTNSTLKETITLQGLHNAFSLSLIDYLGIAAVLGVILVAVGLVWRRRSGSATPLKT
ncbi:MAG TPA: NosD domain-containing protein [Candidatus Bathyarchaeia archaeon]|nr:NosD domain-containing protein [Candidatus Bathyarchaeia archaeon]